MPSLPCFLALTSRQDASSFCRLLSTMPRIPYESHTALNLQPLESAPASMNTFALDNATRHWVDNHVAKQRVCLGVARCQHSNLVNTLSSLNILSKENMTEMWRWVGRKVWEIWETREESEDMIIITRRNPEVFSHNFNVLIIDYLFSPNNESNKEPNFRLNLHVEPSTLFSSYRIS
jgi:hypothetical protein